MTTYRTCVRDFSFAIISQHLDSSDFCRGAFCTLFLDLKQLIRIRLFSIMPPCYSPHLKGNLTCKSNFRCTYSSTQCAVVRAQLSAMRVAPHLTTMWSVCRNVNIQGQLCGTAGRPPITRPEIGLTDGCPQVARATCCTPRT